MLYDDREEIPFLLNDEKSYILNNFDNNKGILKGIISRKKLIFIKGGTFNQSWPIFHQQSNTKELH